MGRSRLLQDRRRLLRGAALAALPAVLAGCLGNGADAPHSWWELEAPGPAGRAEPDRSRARKSLVVEGISAGALYDGTALLYSRAPGVRSPYQFASWTERPAPRIARLAQRRLQARGGFRDVSTADAGVAPDLLLTLTLERMYHDLTTEPSVVQLVVNATVTDWHSRRPIESRRLELAEPVTSEDARGAAAATGRAVSAMLDVLAPWVEALAAREPPQAARPGSPPTTPPTTPIEGAGLRRPPDTPPVDSRPAPRSKKPAGGRPAVNRDGRTPAR